MIRTVGLPRSREKNIQTRLYFEKRKKLGKDTSQRGEVELPTSDTKQ